MSTPTEARETIRMHRIIRDEANASIDDIARAHIPDFHFLDHRVSTFWTCDGSPIGMCVFLLNDRGHATECRYCGGPEERK